MSQTLIVQISDDVYTAIEREAAEAAISPAEVAATSLENMFGYPRNTSLGGEARSEAELQVARERFERHFGALDLGYATGADNESIDRDLADEYSRSHENA